MKKVLVLGAGLVAGPLVKYLLEQENFDVEVATRTVSKAEKLVEGYRNGRADALDVSNEKALEELIGRADIVVSLIPYTHHVAVAKLCLNKSKHFVSTSYVSPEMRELEEEARNRNLILLNEVGLDPGIDHMSAIKIIHEIKEAGGAVESFTSFCGGLPAPESNDNPFGYKFSWSPRGVVLAGKREAQFLENGGIVKIIPEDLFKEYWIADIEGLGSFESYPNGNSLPYIETYDIASTKTLLRGTYRYPGWCDTWVAIKKLDYLDESERELEDMTFAQLTATLCDGNPETVKADAARHTGLDANSGIIGRLEWLGLFSDEKVPIKKGSALDVLASRLLQKLQYKAGEKDMIVLRHEFIAAYEEGKKKIVSTFVGYGEAGGVTAMAKTVGLPAAIATRMILEDKISERGVHIPVKPDIYEPILGELEKVGISFSEKTTVI